MSVQLWNFDSIQEWCINNMQGYKVLDIKWVEKPYQKQLWALVKCPNKNHEEYWVWWNHFKNKQFCKKCNKENKPKHLIWNDEKVYNFYKKYELQIVSIGDFESVDKSILCINKEGFKVFASITNLKANRNPSPFQYNKYALENINLYCALYRPDYRLLSIEYKGVKEIHEWKYLGKYLSKETNRVFLLSIDSFINGGSGHPNLSKSKNEIIIENLLKKFQIKYVSQYTFKDCKNKNKLRFDFAIFDSENNLLFLIEYQGEQHYKPIKFGGISYNRALNTFNKQQINDNIKKTYCTDKDIELLIIPYWKHNNIENILIEKLKDFGFILSLLILIKDRGK